MQRTMTEHPCNSRGPLLTLSLLATFTVGIIFSLCCITIPPSEAASIREDVVRNFSIRLQPELDVIDINAFVRKDHVLKFQLKCLLNNDTWCDPVGRWLAPRIPFILKDGRCPKCTDVQESKIAEGLSYIKREKPEFFEALWNRYINDEGDDANEN